MKVCVLGASANPARYSYRAIQMLLENKHQVFPVHPALKEVQGLSVYKKVQDIPESIHTLTVYVNAQLSQNLEKEILDIKPQRIIFNPGSENPDLKNKATQAGIHCEEACTLVLLGTGQF